MARPTKLTNETQKRFIDALKIGLTYELAASYAGVDVSTFYAWMRRGAASRESGIDDIYSQFHQAIKESEGYAAAACMSKIVKAAEAGHWQSAAWIMERRFGYSRHQDVAISVGEEESLDNVEDLIRRVAAAAEVIESEDDE